MPKINFSIGAWNSFLAVPPYFNGKAVLIDLKQGLDL